MTAKSVLMHPKTCSRGTCPYLLRHWRS